MTIKELEQAVGMTRANIRFYEQEGLIAPARSANGYRDYSDRDVETLERIKLLRRLHLDLDTIRALQEAQTDLPAVLEQQLDTLESDRAALERAREICRQLRDSGTDYAALDARHWLEELDKSDSDLLDKVFLATDTPATRHAWRRFWARLVDIQLYGILLSLLNLWLLHLPPSCSVSRSILWRPAFSPSRLPFFLNRFCSTFSAPPPAKPSPAFPCGTQTAKS